MITRREFVCGVACAAIAGKLAGQEADASKNENLVSPCGTYCGACFMYLATQENNVQRMASGFGSGPMKQPPGQQIMHCDGCLGGGRLSGHVSKCAIRECAATKSKTRRCSDCDEFPCSRITDFNNDGMLHHAVVLGNLRQLRSVGIKEWAKQEDELWRCPKCRTKIAWYDPECPNCKAPRSDKLFPLKKT